jgi:hypothetical protein
MTIIDWAFEHPYLFTMIAIFLAMGIGSFTPFLVNVSKKERGSDGKEND